jgi:peptidoglycan-associated lipoprotein
VPATTSGDLSQDGSGTADESGPATPITERELQTLRENFARVNFDFDRADLDLRSREVLTSNAKILNRHPEVKVQVEGHADHYGSDEYNLALGQRRADVVRQFLIDLGVSPAQLKVLSFGEERPLVAEADKDAEAPNRRAEFMVIVGGDVAESSY